LKTKSEGTITGSLYSQCMIHLMLAQKLLNLLPGLQSFRSHLFTAFCTAFFQDPVITPVKSF